MPVLHDCPATQAKSKGTFVCLLLKARLAIFLMLQWFPFQLSYGTTMAFFAGFILSKFHVILN
jgi:hypothetical protein